MEKVTRDPEKIELALKNRNYGLTVKVHSRTFGDLLAPVSGKMSRLIRESIDSVVHVRLTSASESLLYSGTGKNAGLEIEEKIFKYIH